MSNCYIVACWKCDYSSYNTAVKQSVFMKQQLNCDSCFYFFLSEQVKSYTYKVPSTEEGNKGPFIILALIFLSSLAALVFVYWSFPELQS